MKYSLRRLFVGALLLVPLWSIVIFAYFGNAWAIGALFGFSLWLAAGFCSWIFSGVLHLFARGRANGEGSVQ